MIGKIMALAISLAVASAIATVAASAASAASFTASSYPAAASGGQKTTHVLTVDGAQMTCATANFSATLSEGSSILDVTPTYSGCKAFGFINVAVEIHECKYRLHVGSGSTDEYAGSTDVTCPGSNKIRIHAGTCNLLIGPQTGLGAVTLKNVTGAPNKLEVIYAVGGIEVEVSESGLLCPFETGANTGQYAGSTEFAGGVVSVDVG